MTARIRKLIAGKRAQPTRPREVVKVLKNNSKACKDAVRLCREVARPEGSLYFVRCGEYIKIGYAEGALHARAVRVYTGCPYEFSVVARVPGSPQLEQEMHARFASQQHRDKWFRLEGALKEFLDTIRGKEITLAKRRRSRSRFETNNFETLSPLTELL